MYQEISWQDPFLFFYAISHLPGVVFFDSAKEHEETGRYSFIAFDPFNTVIGKNNIFYYGKKKYNGNPFHLLENILATFSEEDDKNLPPFQGGLAGLFSYELNHYLEKLPRAAKDDLQFPDLALGLYDVVVAFDHLQKKAWIISSGYPEQDKKSREIRSAKRLHWVESLIQQSSLPSVLRVTCDIQQLQQHFTRENYETAVKKVREYILAGDIFQANISRRFHLVLPEKLSVIDLYRRVRDINPAFFGCYFHLAETTIASVSPERFISMRDHCIETRPIKGTRPRGKTAKEDAELAHTLENSAKDRAENMMIVDLMRNDLSRVAVNHSVKVKALCALESHPTVHHLVSTIQARLHDTLTSIDVLRATFPGGSITGAPKIRAMEIITEIEPVCRGPYCGSMGYLGFNGAMDSSILIRTFAIKNNIVTFQAGGAVVADSDPAAEYDETTAKASALVRALSSC
ncbi:MAG: aminodeoxychorismate synthase component I [Gammaproteobacteria bacterium]|nr:aminodeoxychorismate synthase component I [Gammaproteobacteria bacterium]